MGKIKILEECPICHVPTRVVIRDNITKVYCTDINPTNEEYAVPIQIIDRSGAVSYPDFAVKDFMESKNKKER